MKFSPESWTPPLKHKPDASVMTSVKCKHMQKGSSIKSGMLVCAMSVYHLVMKLGKTLAYFELVQNRMHI